MTKGGHRAIRRVLLVLQSVSVGGMEAQCAALVREFVPLGIEVAVVVPAADMFDELAERLTAAGARVERLDTDARGGRMAQAAAMIRLVGLMRAWEPDAVHLHTGGPTGGIAPLIAARLLTPATVILTEHNVPFEEPGTRLRLGTRLKDLLAHAVVVLSARNAAQRRMWLGEPRNFAGIPPGIRIEPIDPELCAARRAAVRQALDISPSGVVIATVCRQTEDKGLDDLVRAFAYVRRSERCDLVLVGDGPLRSRLQALAAELGVATATHFVGDQRDPGPFLDASDVFVLASPRGSGSVALLEAMARGLPAVITYCGPGEFLVAGETGECAPPSDARGLARVLIEIVRDPERRATLGWNGAVRARERFRIEDVARDLIDVYASVKGAAIPERVRAARLDAW